MPRGKRFTSPCRLIALYIVIPNEKVLKPGETVALYPRKVAVERVLEGKADPNALFSTPTIRVPAGEVQDRVRVNSCKAS